MTYSNDAISYLAEVLTDLPNVRKGRLVRVKRWYVVGISFVVELDDGSELIIARKHLKKYF